MTNHLIIITIAHELGLKANQIARTTQLLDEDNTVPFIARYRKEVTGGLDEEQLRAIQTRLNYLRHLEERKETVLKSIAEQGKLTPELEARIRAAMVLQEVEDLYLPYKPKRRTRATIARERGLEPLAELILAQEVTEGTLEQFAQDYLSEEVPTVEDAYAGARDIVAEGVSEDADLRKAVRERTFDQGLLVCAVADAPLDPQGKYQMYYEYSEPLKAVRPHRLLAINRGDKEGVLKVKVEAPVDEIMAAVKGRYLKNERSIFAAQVREAAADGYKRLIAPSIERGLRGTCTDEADDHAIKVFATNLGNLLLQPPLQGKRVMGIDPGYRTGCKVALVDETGKFLGGTTIYPHGPQKQWDEARKVLVSLVTKGNVDVIAIGNGTASRETEALAAEVIAEAGRGAYVIVNEAGASVYSASPLAREELPDMDVSMRGAVSIARRLQDPLAELVKIEPRSVGVGLYQHDVDQKKLAETLDAVVESAVNHVGVGLNTASPALLQYVSGINKRVAKAIVRHRDEHGPFKSRQELKKVKGIGDKGSEQSAGFLKIPTGENPLDNTFIHPESYPGVERLFALMGVQGDEPDLAQRVKAFRAENDLAELAEVLEVGLPTLTDIFDNLIKPGRDPRDELPKPILRSDVLKMEDLREGMILKGTVRNVVDFGAFVDIGVKQDGLVHVSQMADRYVKNPLEVVSVGDVVEVKVISLDPERGRIGLSMKK
ncbi:MAG: RNA-binding transcriptional accessory protein [Anaerolineales bacterium]|nr:MAG: RNA-binding transcriptional accessory protein [Anaerolineales bacterium]